MWSVINVDGDAGGPIGIVVRQACQMGQAGQ